MNFYLDELDDKKVIDKIREEGKKRKLPTYLIDFVASFFDKSIPLSSGQAYVQEQIDLNPDIPDNIKTKRKNIRYNTKGKEAMLENVKVMSKIFGKEFLEVIGWDFFGFHFRIMDIAKKKRTTGKPGEFYERFLEIYDNAPSTNLDLDYNVKDVRILNLGVKNGLLIN